MARFYANLAGHAVTTQRLRKNAEGSLPESPLLFMPETAASIAAFAAA